MTDDELAQGIVDFEIGDYSDKDDIFFIYSHPLESDMFVRDPRVAMAAMEKCDYIEISHGNSGWVVSTWKGSQWINVENESLELAITTACYEALRGSDYG